MRAFRLLSPLFAFALLASGPSEALRPDRTICLLPLGAVEPSVLEAAERGIETAFQFEVSLLPSKELPPEAYYPPRKRYRADRLLDYLASFPKTGGEKIVGLTAKDISTTKAPHADWGIFGLGELGGRACVISTFRLKRDKPDHKKFLERLQKVVNHEAAHTFGLPHCPAEGCLMQDARGSIKTVDSETGDLCPACREKLKGIIY